MILCHVLKKMEKLCNFPLNNTFFAPYRVRRFSTGFGDSFCRVSETFPQGSWPLGLPYHLNLNPLKIKHKINKKKNTIKLSRKTSLTTRLKINIIYLTYYCCRLVGRVGSVVLSVVSHVHVILLSSHFGTGLMLLF